MGLGALSSRRSTVSLLIAAVMSLLEVSATVAAPVGPSVVTGSATVEGIGTSKVTIRQATQQAVIHWREFNIAPNEVAHFIQPNSAAIALNRIFDANPSQILGSLQANGHVILLNPNGVMFGPKAQVNVGSITASSLHLSTENFLAGRYHFEGLPTNGAVKNAGSIEANAGGVYLLAPNVENNGIIKAPNGQIMLAAGSTVYLSNRPDGLGLLAEVKAPAGHATNLKDLIADGGTVTLAGRVVNQEGLIQANSVRERKGKIELFASDTLHIKAGSKTLAKGGEEGVSHAGDVVVVADTSKGTTTFEKGATIDVSGGTRGGNAGFVELSGKNVITGGLVSGSALSGYRHGRVLIDPTEISSNTLASSFQGINDIELTSTSSDGELLITANFDLMQNLWLLPPGEGGTLKFTASNTIRFDRARITSDVEFLEGAPGTPWNIEVKSMNGDILLTGSTIQTSLGGKITLSAGLDIRLTNSSLLKAAEGGDMTVTAGRNLFIPFSITGSQNLQQGIVSGVWLEGTGNLTMTAVTGDYKGSAPGTAASSPGFIIDHGKATVTAGGQVGSGDGYLNVTVGSGVRQGSTGLDRIAPASEVDVTAGADLYLGLVQDKGLVEGALRSFTGDPATSVTLTSRAGDIHLKPSIGSNTGFDAFRGYYPPTFSATAESGSILVESPLTFWPSTTGSISLLAKKNISGEAFVEFEVEDPNFIPPVVLPRFPGDVPPPVVPPRVTIRQKVPTNVRLLNADPATLVGPTFNDEAALLAKVNAVAPSLPDHLPGNVSLKAIDGNISGFNLNMFSPAFLRKVTLEAGGDMSEIIGKFSVPDLGKDAGGQDIVPVTISAGGNLSLKKTAQTPSSGLEFIGPGRADIRVRGDLNLGDSLGIRHRLTDLPSDQSDSRGLIDISLGGNLVMTQSRIATSNGAGIAIHGFGTDPLVGADGHALADIDGTPLLAEGRLVDVDGRQELHAAVTFTLAEGVPPSGGLQVQGSTAPLPALDNQTRTIVAIEEAVQVKGAPLILTGSEPVLSSGQVTVGGKVPLFQGKPLLPLLTRRGGKPILLDGKVVMTAGDQVVLVPADLVVVQKPTGGSIDIGTNQQLNSTDSPLPLGIVTLRGGDIDIRAKGDVNVNLSRVGTFGSPSTPKGGDIRIASTQGSINAGSGSKKELTTFTIIEDVRDANGNPVKDANGNPIQTSVEVQVPGSGIFTFHASDPRFPLNFPEFETAEIAAARAEFAKLNFFGRDTTQVRARLDQLVKDREPIFEQLFEDFINQNPDKGGLPLQLGDITLLTKPTGKDIIVPPAGIRGKRINLQSGRNLTLQGGSIEGQSSFDVEGEVEGSLTAFVGAFSGAAGTTGSVSGGASASGAGSLGGGLTGATGGVTAATSSTASTASTTTNTVQQVTDSASAGAAQQAVAKAKTSSDKAGTGKTTSAKKSIRLKSGVTIQVDVKERKGL